QRIILVRRLIVYRETLRPDSLQCRYLFLLIIPRPPISTLFPYTTLFRSRKRSAGGSVPAGARSPSARRRRRASRPPSTVAARRRSEEHTSELQSHLNLVCRLLLEKKNRKQADYTASAVLSKSIENSSLLF